MTHRNDNKLALLMAGSNVDWKAWDGVVSNAVKRLTSAFETTVDQWGAGYCYMHLVPPGARTRVGRILGPEPYVADVVRALRVVGLNEGFFHLELLYFGCHISVGPEDGKYKGRSSLEVFYALISVVDMIDETTLMA
jgi:hypothetical protein